MKFHKYIPILALVLFTILHGEATNETTYVTYDSRSLVIHGNRELLYSGSVHYPRVPVEVKLMKPCILMHDLLGLTIIFHHPKVIK